MLLRVLIAVLIAISTDAFANPPEAPTMLELLQLSHSKLQELVKQNTDPRRIEFQSAEYFYKTTPEVFLKRSVLEDRNKYINFPQEVNPKEIVEIIEYISRDELYRHNFQDTERFLKEYRFGGKSFSHKGLHTQAPFEFMDNFKHAHALLQKYDRDYGTSYAQVAVLEHLKRIFNSPQRYLVTDLNNRLFMDFVGNLGNYDRSSAQDVLSVAQQAIKYYQERLTTASREDRPTIHRYLIKIAEQAFALSKEHGQNQLLTHEFGRVLKVESEYANKQGVDTTRNVHQSEKNARNLPAAQKKENTEKDIREIVAQFISNVFKADEKKTQPFDYKGSTFEILVKSYTPRTSNQESNVVSLMRKETIFHARIINPSVHAHEGMTLILKSLFADPMMYGIYFDDRVKVPDFLKNTDYEMISMGEEVLVKRRPPVRRVQPQVGVSCPALFMKGAL